MSRSGKPPGNIELPPKTIKVMLESSLKGDSYKETAEKAGVSKNTVYRMRKDLKLI